MCASGWFLIGVQNDMRKMEKKRLFFPLLSVRLKDSKPGLPFVTVTRAEWAGACLGMAGV